MDSKNIDDNRVLCSAPWVSLFYNKNSSRVCCVNSESIPGSPEDFQKSDFLINLRKEFLEGQKPESCRACWDDESNGHQSIRTKIYTRFPLSKESLTPQSDIGLSWLELRASNLCNFSCRMCHPNESTQLLNDLEKNQNAATWYVNEPSLSNWLKLYDISDITDENFEIIKSKLGTVSHLFLAGGEPMLIKKYYDLLDYMIEQGYNKSTTVQFSTNVSTLNPIILDKLKQFDNLMVTLSIDATAEIASYQRNGSNWETIRDNALELVKLPNIRPSVNSAISAYTILDIDNLAAFYSELVKQNRHMAWNMSPVHRPHYLNPTVLPKSLKKRAIERLERSILVGNDIAYMPIHRFMQSATALLNHLKQTENDVSPHTEEFIKFTKDLDLLHNKNFNQVFDYCLYD